MMDGKRVEFGEKFFILHIRNLLLAIKCKEVNGFKVKFKNCSEMFRPDGNGSSINEIDFSGADTSEVTDMRRMFWGCNNLTYLDLSRFDTSNVTDMSGMFDGCHSLTSLNLSNFDTSNVTSMQSMFQDC